MTSIYSSGHVKKQPRVTIYSPHVSFYLTKRKKILCTHKQTQSSLHIVQLDNNDLGLDKKGH